MNLNCIKDVGDILEFEKYFWTLHAVFFFRLRDN